MKLSLLLFLLSLLLPLTWAWADPAPATPTPSAPAPNSAPTVPVSAPPTPVSTIPTAATLSSANNNKVVAANTPQLRSATPASLGGLTPKNTPASINGTGVTHKLK